MTENQIEGKEDFSSQEKNLEFQCEYCNKVNVDECRLQQHKDMFHRIGNYNCSSCPRKFLSEVKFIEHVQDCKGEDIKSLECFLCSAEYGKEAYVKDHIYKIHKVFNYKCRGCKKKFYRRSEFKDHKKVCSQTECMSHKILPKRYIRRGKT